MTNDKRRPADPTIAGEALADAQAPRVITGTGNIVETVQDTCHGRGDVIPLADYVKEHGHPPPSDMLAGKEGLDG